MCVWVCGTIDVCRLWLHKSPAWHVLHWGEGVGSQVKPVRCDLRKMQPLKKEKPKQTKTSTTTNGIWNLHIPPPSPPFRRGRAAAPPLAVLVVCCLCLCCCLPPRRRFLCCCLCVFFFTCAPRWWLCAETAACVQNLSFPLLQVWFKNFLYFFASFASFVNYFYLQCAAAACNFHTNR